MSVFRIDDIYRVSFRPSPITVGRTDDMFSVGDQVELFEVDRSTVHGVLEGIEIHRSLPDNFRSCSPERYPSKQNPGT